MKKYNSFFVFLLCINFSLFCQEKILQYDMTAGGKFKPSKNFKGEYLRVLFVFAEFKNDESVVADWPKGCLPVWAHDIVDKEVTSEYRNHTISDYFKKMSCGKFDIIGDVFEKVITLPSSVGREYTWANRELLDSLNKHIQDFKRYDNWKVEDGRFVFSEGKGDGYFDMIHLIYRNADSQVFKCGGRASIGCNYTTHDGIRLCGTFLRDSSSGITTNMAGRGTNSFQFVQHFAHEFGHYLFGHLHTAVGGIMAGYNYYGITYAMSAWERERLGYIDIRYFDTAGEVTLRDYVETGDALKIPVAEGEILVLENHQRHSSYDQIIRGGSQNGLWDPESQAGKGLYVYYIRNQDVYPCETYALTADGGWNWKSAGYMDNIPLVDRGNPYRYLPSTLSNEIGKGDRNPCLKADESNAHYESWYSRNEFGEWIFTRPVMGDDNDAFNTGYNELITPWSNPGLVKLVNGKEEIINLGIRLLSNDPVTGEIRLIIYNNYQDIIDLPPSKPQNLLLNMNENNHPVLSWSKNPEPDLLDYRVFRINSTDSICLTDTIYVDYNFAVTGLQSDELQEYWIEAIDSTNQSSVTSEHRKVWGKRVAASDISGGQLSREVPGFYLYQNFPNPFNASTVIRWQIPEGDYVTLKVYDITGRQTDVLVNEFRPAGEYQTELNGADLSGGVYFLRLSAGKHFSIRKMILLK